MAMRSSNVTDCWVVAVPSSWAAVPSWLAHPAAASKPIKTKPSHDFMTLLSFVGPAIEVIAKRVTVLWRIGILGESQFCMNIAILSTRVSVQDGPSCSWPAGHASSSSAAADRA
ncbi:MAG TPA: hypothetical protein VF516_04700 [Kofleriaceae bacterium]